MDLLELSDGRRVELGARATNGSKNETRFGSLDGRPVVVKIQRAHGRPDDEKVALDFLHGAGVRVPRVVATGATSHGRRFLVITREEGFHTESPDGWARFGRDLAALVRVPVSGCPLRCEPMARFQADHRERLDAVRPLVSPTLAVQIEEAIARVGQSTLMVVTHGDPGTGNYLDTGDDSRLGVLLDWETASVSPFGLDFGRAAFICMLDLRHSGIAEQLAPAFIRSYVESVAPAAELTEQLSNSWIIVAALQFIHGRHMRPLVAERTPHAAARVLERYLATAR